MSFGVWADLDTVPEQETLDLAFLKALHYEG